MAKDEDYSWIMWAAIAAGIYLVVSKLGLGASDLLGTGAGNTDYNQQVALPSGANAFSPSFQPFIDFYNNNGPQDSAGNVIPIETVFTNPQLQRDVNGNSIWGTIDTVALGSLAQHLQNITNQWALFTDQSSVLAALNAFTTQLQVAFVANYFHYMWGQDLLSSLKGSIFQTGLTDTNLAALITRVNNLPIS